MKRETHIWKTTILDPFLILGMLALGFSTSFGQLTSARNQFWHQDIGRIWGAAEGADRFGWATATGDFNGDGVG